MLLLCSSSGCGRDDGSASSAGAALRAALNPERLGVAPEAPIEQWIARLQSNLRGRPRPHLYGSERGADALERADEVLRAGWVLRDRKPVLLTPPIAWGEVPDGDVNWHYSLNALHPLTDVLFAYGQTQRRAYLDAARAVMLDWIDFNITRAQPNEKKWYDMGTGYRAEKLAFILDEELRSPAPAMAELALLLGAAVEHARVLSDPKVLPSGNHGIFMMLGLAALCRTVPELADCDARAGYASRTFEQILEKQFNFDEAIHLEGAPSYHVFMSDTLDRLRRTGLFATNPRVAGLLEAIPRHVPRMFHPNGDAVLIGDSATDSLTNFVEQSAEARFVQSEGRSGTAPDPASVAFPKTGYAVFRSPWTEQPFSRHSFLFFSAAWHKSSHNHRDHFTFEWSERGFPILVDSGKFTYDKGKQREFFRSTRAGNALEIDARDLAETPAISALRSFGQVGPLHFADATARRGKIQHTRVLVLNEGQWLCVVDRLSAPAEHTYRQWFHFHEDIAAEQLAEPASLALTLPNGGPKVFVSATASSGSPAAALVKGQSGKRPQGWVSRDYQVKVPRYSASFTRAGQSLDLVSVFALDAAPGELTLKAAPESLELRWHRNGRLEGFSHTVEAGQGRVRAINPD